MSFKKINIEDLNVNPVTMTNKEWLLITAGNETSGYNTMTASWGHLGTIWGKSTATVYIRPHRYTKEFVDKNDLFTLTVFASEYKKALGYLGKVSGRDEDKIAKVGLTPAFLQNTTYFEEAKLVFICKKLYHAPILEEGFVDKSLIDPIYPQKDFHEVYVGEIIDVLIKE